MSKINFGLTLHLALRLKGRSQKWLALNLDVPPQNVSRWAGKEDANLSTIVRVSSALDMTASEFVALGECDEA